MKKLGIVVGRISACVFAIAALLALSGCGAGVPDTVVAGLAGGSGNDVPSPDELKKTGPLKENNMGRAGAPVTIIEYASLGCPICGYFHKTVFPQFKKAYIDTGKVHYIFREFPIGKSPTAAAQAVRCGPEKDYFSLNEKFMARRGQWNARNPDPDLLYKIVKDTGLSRTAFDSCMSNQEIQDGLRWVKQRGRELGVKGTPTFFINDDKVRGVLSYDDLKALVDKHIASTANPA